MTWRPVKTKALSRSVVVSNNKLSTSSFPQIPGLPLALHYKRFSSSRVEITCGILVSDTVHPFRSPRPATSWHHSVSYTPLSSSSCVSWSIWIQLQAIGVEDLHLGSFFRNFELCFACNFSSASFLALKQVVISLEYPSSGNNRQILFHPFGIVNADSI